MNRIVQKRRKSGAKNGFTLIEIMVVMIIVGMLAAVVTPIVFDRLEGAQIANERGRWKPEFGIRPGSAQLAQFPYPNRSAYLFDIGHRGFARPTRTLQ